jgi:acetyl-CoA synthetase
VRRSAGATRPELSSPTGRDLRPWSLGRQVATLAFVRYETIVKARESTPVPANLTDYEQARREFSWAAARHDLDGLPGGALNIAHECVDRHALGARRDHLAIRWLGRHGETRDLTYHDLRLLTNRFANVLDNLGLERDERVFVLADRIPELYVSVLGALKHGSTVCTLFSAFGPEPIRQRMAIGAGRVLVTTERLYRRKVAPIRDQLPDLEHVVLIGLKGEPTDVAGTLDFASLLEDASDNYAIAPTRPDDVALLHFTSGTTGTPKGAVHVHEAVVAHAATGRSALDLHPEDVFWCTADPGWVTGTSYGIVAPLAIGVTSIVDEGDFDAERWYAVLDDQRVSVWYTAPTAVRMMMKVGADVAREHRLPNLRFIASVGEPLNPEAVRWGQEAFGLPIHDNWWQTETGGIMIANFAATDIRPGSMGRPVPGIDAVILRRDEHGHVVVRDGTPEILTEPLVEGELAIRRGWPSMFRAYLGQPDRYGQCFLGDWYLSGDLAMRDDDGYFWFVGRADDVIKSAGHLIGPFEVESALMEHPAVAEAGVIGKPDPVAGELVKAFVVLRPGNEASDALRLELIGFGRSHLGAAIAPKELEFRADLPKTRSGKIMRRLLRARELGLPEGDISTLESGS